MNKTKFEKIAHSPSLRIPWIFILLITIPFFRYFDVKNFDFVSFDDGLHICNNPRMEQVSKASILSFWKEPYEHLYIPVSYTAWSFLEVISKNEGAEKPVNPAVFHWANLILHLINTILVFLILRKIINDDWAVLAGSLVFSLHPLQIESVAWISEFRGLLSGSFVLAAILIVLREFQNKSDNIPLKNYWEKIKSIILLTCASLFFLCALLSKPSAIATPLIAGTLAFHLKNRRCLFVVLGLWVLLAFPLMLFTGKEQVVNMTLPLWQRPFIFLDAIGFYISKILLPVSLCIDYGRTPHAVIQNYSWLPMSLVAISASLLLLLLRKRVPNIIRSSLVFFFALLPVSGMIPFLFQTYSTVADRYLYLPMIGIALLVASVLATVRRIGAITVIGGWIVFLVVLGAQQLTTWQSSRTLYDHALKINPNSYFSLNNLGNTFFERGNFKTALSWYRKAIIKKPDFAGGYFNCGKVFNEIGNYPAAINFCARALFYIPNYFKVHELLGEIYSKGGKNQTAMENYKQALNLGDSSYGVFIAIATLYQKTNQRDSAIAYLLFAASKKKCPSEIYNNVAVQYLLFGEKNKAFKYFSNAISCNPKEIFARLNRGRLLQEIGECREAKRDFEDVLKNDPANTFAREQLDENKCDSVKRK